MTSLSLTPLFRSTVGFDRFSDLFQSLAETDGGSNTYPPYNIEKYGENQYSITMAVAGFNESDLNITTQNDSVTVSGQKEEKSEEKDAEYLYRGIASRAFERTFQLADHMKVTGAELKDGLLRIELVREIPEERKPRTIQINGRGQKAIEHSVEGKDRKRAA